MSVYDKHKTSIDKLKNSFGIIEVNVDDRCLSGESKTFVIAEAANNHMWKCILQRN